MVTLSVTPSGGSAIQDFIDGLHIDHDTSGDDFGVSLGGNDIALSDGALVSWSGQAIFAVDKANLNRGTYTFANIGNASIYGTLPVTMNVPEPGSMMLFTSGLVSAGFFRQQCRRTQ